MERPLFSIITITFNAAGTLPATLRSVELQTFTDYEYLIVDGASTDGTVAIAQHSAAVSSVTSEPDKGLYDAMNKGLRKARGCYLVFLNAGDAFHEPDTLQKIADSIEKNDSDIVYGETALVDSERRFISMRRLQAPERLSVKSFRMGMLVWKRSVAWMGLSRPGVVWVCFWVPGPPPHSLGLWCGSMPMRGGRRPLGAWRNVWRVAV